MKKNVTCIICPMSCRITVCGEDKKIESIEGYNCKRGKEYAETEFICPKRNLTAIVKAEGYKTPVISVRTSKPIPKDMQAECMEIIKSIVVKPPFETGRTVAENILDTGSDLILTNE